MLEVLTKFLPNKKTEIHELPVEEKRELPSIDLPAPAVRTLDVTDSSITIEAYEINEFGNEISSNADSDDYTYGILLFGDGLHTTKFQSNPTFSNLTMDTCYQITAERNSFIKDGIKYNRSRLAPRVPIKTLPCFDKTIENAESISLKLTR